MNCAFQSLLPLVSIISFLPCARGLAAQDPAARRDLHWPPGAVLHDVDSHGAVWSSGAAYKARFDAQGMTFWAASGAAAPAPQAQFALKAVRQGAAHLPLCSASPERKGDRVSFARGSLVEFYDVRPEGVEQQFLLHALPGAGELVVEVGVSTDLTVARAEVDHVLHGAHGAIRYGEAIAIDAAGARLPLEVRWQDGAFLITVPETFLAGAQLPLLIDPMVGVATTVWSAGTRDLVGTDIAFDQSLGRYFVVYERVFSATDRDVFVSYLDAAMATPTLLVIDNTTEYWSEPRIAVLEAHDVAAVVAEKSAAGAAPFAIALRRIVGTTVQPPLLLSGITGVHYRHPGIGGDANPNGPSRFLVAYERSDAAVNANEIWFGLLDWDGLSLATTFLGTGISFKRRMSISKTCAPVGDAQARWAILYRSEPYQQTTGTLRVSMVSRGGNSFTSTAITGATPNAGSEWAVSSGIRHAAGTVFLASEIRVNAQGRGDVYLHAFTGHGNVTLVAGEVLLLAGTADHRNPAVDSDGTRFALSCSARLSATDADLRMRTLALLGNQLAVQDVANVSLSGDLDVLPSLCHAGAPNTYGLAFVRRTSAPSQVVMAQLYRGLGAGALVTRTTGCGAVTLTHSGTPALGETFTLAVQSNAALRGFLVGRPVSQAIAACAGCALGADGVMVLGTSLPLTIPNNVTLVGVVAAAQGFAVDLAGLPCLGQIALSNTLDFRVQ